MYYAAYYFGFLEQMFLMLVCRFHIMNLINPSPTPTSVHCSCNLLPKMKQNLEENQKRKTNWLFLRLHFNCIFLFLSPASKPPIYPPFLSFKLKSSFSTSYHCTQIWICIYTNMSKHNLLSPHNVICMYDFRADFLTLDMFRQWCWWDFMSLVWLRNSLRAKHLILWPWNLSFPSFTLLPEPWV